jgi:hypothetical protein
MGNRQVEEPRNRFKPFRTLSGSSFTFSLTPEPSRPGEPPPEVRVRQLLKLALRAFRLRASWPAHVGDARISGS